MKPSVAAPKDEPAIVTTFALDYDAELSMPREFNDIRRHCAGRVCWPSASRPCRFVNIVVTKRPPVFATLSHITGMEDWPMDIVNRICITWLCLFLACGAVVTYRHHLAERQGVAAQTDMANARASLPKFETGVASAQYFGGSGGGTGSNPNSHYVAPHTTSNGTYVQGHQQTNPNNTQRGNYGTSPNVNPFSGQTGTRGARY